MVGDEQVLEHRHALEQPDVLEGARDAGLAGDLVVGHALEQKELAVRRRRVPAARTGDGRDVLRRRDAVAGEREPPLGRLVEAGDAIEDGRLAGAVRADQRGDVAASDRKAEGVHRDEAAEPHREVFDGEQRARSASSSAVPLLDEIAGHGSFAPSRKIDGMRVETRPRGFQIIMMTIAAPNSSMRYWVGSKSSPKIAFIQSSSRMSSGTPIITAAAMATPSCEPMPPSTTMARIVADSMKVKLSGLTNPCRTAKNEPAKPPNIAPSAKAVSLVLVVLMPSERQAISSSRKRLPGPADRQPAQPEGHEIGQKREREDQIEKEDRAVDRRVRQMEDRGEAVVLVVEGNAEEGDLGNAADAGVAVGEIDPVDQHHAG